MLKQTKVKLANLDHLGSVLLFFWTVCVFQVGGGKAETFENHSAMEIAEQLTLLDHLVFKVIPYEWVSSHHTARKHEHTKHASLLLCWFASQGILWPRLDEEWQKWENAVYHEDNEALQWRTLQSKRALITHRTLLSKRNMKSKLLVSRFFCQMSNLIATEILRCDDVVTRVAVIEKWVAVADICRCLHNYNAVLEITSSLNRSSVFRLKKTWLKVSKQVRVSICIAASPWSAWYCHWTCSLSPFFSRLKHWLTNCRSWSHQRGGSKTSERLWRSEFKDIVSDWINKANKQHKWMISGFYSLFFLF